MATTVAQRWSVLLTVLVLLVASLPALSAPVKFFTTGYVQGRYSDLLGTSAAAASNPGTFNIQRAYFVVDATVDDNVGAVLVAAHVTNGARLEHAYARYVTKPFQFRLGLSPLPFGYEAPLTSCKLVTLERSKVVDNLFISAEGIPGSLYILDRGAMAYYLPGKGFNAEASVSNGNGILTSADANNAKVFTGRIGHYLPGGDMGVSLYTGKRSAGAAIVSVRVLGLDVETKTGPYTIIGEVLTGKDNGIEKDGGYVTVAYRKNGSVSEPYLRYDIFDPNKNVASDNYKRVTAGYSYYLNPNSKLTLELQRISDKLDPNVDGAVGFQYQVIF